MIVGFDTGGDPAALVVGAVLGDFLATRAESGNGDLDEHGDVEGAVDFGLEAAFEFHHAGFAGDGGGFFHEEREVDVNVGFFGLESFAETG